MFAIQSIREPVTAGQSELLSIFVVDDYFIVAAKFSLPLEGHLDRLVTQCYARCSFLCRDGSILILILDECYALPPWYHAHLSVPSKSAENGGNVVFVIIVG